MEGESPRVKGVGSLPLRIKGRGRERTNVYPQTQDETSVYTNSNTCVGRSGGGRVMVAVGTRR